MYSTGWATGKTRATPSFTACSCEDDEHGNPRDSNRRWEDWRSHGSSLRASVYRSSLPLGECPFALRDGRQRTPDFSRFPELRRKNSAKGSNQLAQAFALGGWLGGALQWHLTFMWIYIATGLLYIGYQIFSGNYKQVLFVRRDFPGVWPMVRHYFFFGPKPPVREAYNPLQKHAYTSAIGLGVLSVLTGFAIWKPVQFSWLAWMMGGFHLARLWHFLIMWAMLAFVFGPSGDGGPPWLEQLRLDVDRMEEGPGVPIGVMALSDCGEFGVAVRSDAGRTDFAGRSSGNNSTKRC